MLCLTVEAITNAAESTWDPVKRKATSVEDRDRNAALEDIDAIEWIKTQPAEKPKAENLKKFMEARNPKSHFDITNIMDDESVSSLLKLSGTSNNNTKFQRIPDPHNWKHFPQEYSFQEKSKPPKTTIH